MNKSVPKIMGIVNVTPDSFSDGGRYFDHRAAIEHGMKLIEDGADILDIGGESTRPGALPVSAAEEQSRVVPVRRELAKTGTLISIDTRDPEVIRAAIDAGADFINDISALQNPVSLRIAAEMKLPVCLMHMKGSPKTMQDNPAYDNVVQEVFDFLAERIKSCVDAGIDKKKIYADIGIGFGKTSAHNVELLRSIDRFSGLGVPLVLGTSRKKFIEALSSTAGPGHRLGGSIATALWAMEKNISVLRVHDVAPTRQALSVWSELGRDVR